MMDSLPQLVVNIIVNKGQQADPLCMRTLIDEDSVCRTTTPVSILA